MQLQDALNELRVLVNNQNTRVATVTIPTLSFGRRQSRQKPTTCDELTLKKQEPLSDYSNPLRHGVDGHSAGCPAGILRSELCPQLDNIYNRVMRRLQWRTNYEEISSPSLAVQFGIVDEAGDGLSQVRNNLELDDRPISLSTISSSTTRQSQQQGRRLPRVVPISKGDEDSSDMQILSQQPCPKTLRLVLEEVTTTVTTKLRAANAGSLKDCLCFVFESRALLDRLLKEIPSYSQFQGDGERLPTAMQLHDMYQEFRQQPVVVPGSCYLKDEISGRVVAFLDQNFESMSHSMPPGVSAVAPENVQQERSRQPKENEPTVFSENFRTNISRPSVMLDMSHSGTGGVSSKVSLGNGIAVSIPPTYGKSARTRRGTMCPQRGGAIGRARASFTLPHASSSSVCSSVHDAAQLAAVDGATQEERPIAPRSPESGAIFPRTSKQQEQLESVRCRRATQTTSIGVLTDINNTTMVSREEYDNLQLHVKLLNVEIEECRRESRELQEQLREEQMYTSQKRKVVQYLRETLYKECNVLRSQLSAAQQKQIQYQSLLKEQQQQALALAASYEARNAANNPPHESVRFPNLGLRSVAPESSVMMMHSMAPFSRPFNPNISVFSLARNNHVEEHDDVNGPTVVKSLSPSGAGGVLMPTATTTTTTTTTAAAAATTTTNTTTVTTPRRLSVDITAIQSLLDLVLLAVENDQVLPSNISRAKNMNTAIIASAMTDDPHARETALRAQFDEWQRQMKESYTMSRLQMVSLLEIKERQIAHLKSSSDTQFLRRYWEQKGEALRNDLRRIRNLVHEQMDDFRKFMLTTMQGIINRARLVDTTLRENHTLYTTQSALRDMISSAHTLLIPMLTTEYARGYHPWPLRLRNTADPLHQILQARYGDGQVMLLREEMNTLGDIYVAVHNFVIKHQTVPQMKRPMPGPTLRQLCALLVLNSAASSDVWTRVRDMYAKERAFQRKIARLNMSLVALLYHQRILTERSVEAMRQAGMDPRVIGLPAQRTINKAAEELQNVILERANLRKQRQDNAREVYRLWRSQQVDVFEGYAPPTLPQRLVIGAGSPHAVHLTGARAMNEARRSSCSASTTHTTFWNRVLSPDGEKEAQPVAQIPPLEVAADTLVEASSSSSNEKYGSG